MAVEDIRDFEAGLYAYVDSMNPKLLSTLMEKRVIDDSVKADIEKTLRDFKQSFVSARQVAASRA